MSDRLPIPPFQCMPDTRKPGNGVNSSAFACLPVPYQGERMCDRLFSPLAVTDR
jgi:hypothetical protein